jgi:hypothetical protein
MLLPSPEGIASSRLIVHVRGFYPLYLDRYLSFLFNYILQL